MAATQFTKVVRHIHRMASGTHVLEQTDHELLDAFALHADEQAFAQEGRCFKTASEMCGSQMGHIVLANDLFDQSHQRGFATARCAADHH